MDLWNSTISCQGHSVSSICVPQLANSSCWVLIVGTTGCISIYCGKRLLHTIFGGFSQISAFPSPRFFDTLVIAQMRPVVYNPLFEGPRRTLLLPKFYIRDWESNLRQIRIPLTLQLLQMSLHTPWNLLEWSLIELAAFGQVCYKVVRCLRHHWIIFIIRHIEQVVIQMRSAQHFSRSILLACAHEKR